MRYWISFVSVVFAGAITASAQPPLIETGTVKVRTEVFATGLPIAGAFNNGGVTDVSVVPGADGTLAASNYGGEIFLFDSMGNMQTAPFLELANPASDSFNPNFAAMDANGLVSVAFHPDFASTTAPGYGRFYTLEAEMDGVGTPDFAGSVVQSSFRPHRQALYEYTLDSHTDSVCGTNCAMNKRELFRVAQPGWHHNLGDLQFAPDGSMFISAGDGDVAGMGLKVQTSDNSQMLSNIFGKVLRIDPLGSNSANGQYGIPDDNPFVGTSGLNEIYAYGLRNPNKLALDSVTGDLIAGEVGELSVESVDLIVAGGNYGWNVKEGSYLYNKLTKSISEDVDSNGDGIGDVAAANGFIEPVLEYSRLDGRSIIGGVAYQGGGIAGLAGNYVFGDFGQPNNSGRIFYGDIQSGEVSEFVLDDDSAPLPLRIWSVNHDGTGELLVSGVIRNSQGDLEGYMIRLFAAVTGDFDDNDSYDCLDIDALVGEIISGDNVAAFDITNDGLVNSDDLYEWLKQAGLANEGVTGGQPFLPGDANLDGNVDGVDFQIWSTNKFTATPSWCSGDFDADGSVDGVDFLIWNEHKFQTSLPVPESSNIQVFVVMFGLALCRWRQTGDMLPARWIESQRLSL